MTLVKNKTRKSLFPSLSNLFDTDIFERSLLGVNGLQRNLEGSVPSVNITETNEDFRIELAAPGLEKKDFKVEVESGILTISGEKQENVKEDEPKFWKREFSYLSFCRSFNLPENSQPEKIEARYENGILEVKLPKNEISAAKPKKTVAVL
jgi:HSP20 family protein